MTKTWTVIWRQGGTHRCRWRLILTRFMTLEAARAKVAELERMGYKAIAQETEVLDRVGIPIGWDTTTSALDWELREDGFYWHKSVA